MGNGRYDLQAALENSRGYGDKVIHAACLMRPTGIDDIQPKSVVKKLKDKAFAAGVDLASR